MLWKIHYFFCSIYPGESCLLWKLLVNLSVVPAVNMRGLFSLLIPLIMTSSTAFLSQGTNYLTVYTWPPRTWQSRFAWFDWKIADVLVYSIPALRDELVPIPKKRITAVQISELSTEKLLHLSRLTNTYRQLNNVIIRHAPSVDHAHKSPHPFSTNCHEAITRKGER